jgi:mediator of RNA polymerase II transcription subunit 5
MQTVPVGGPYQKDDLVSQINNRPERAEQLIGEIESMEGNAGAIVGAITEVCPVPFALSNHFLTDLSC